LKIESGEEIVATLQAFAERRAIRAGGFWGLGAVGETELGFFVPARKEYVRRVFVGDHEIASLVGNFSEMEGKPFPHPHIVIAGEDFRTHAGHLFRGIVSVTCEIQIATDPGILRRVRRDDQGFHPLQLSE
jgi:hypothetical protein